MASELIEGTRIAFPRVWLTLSVPAQPCTQADYDQLATSAVERGAVIDISSSPAMWGAWLRGAAALLMVRGGTEFERAPSDKIAYDLVQADLVQTLSAIGREWIDFYFLRIRSELPELQIDGAIRALVEAKREGHIRFLGIEFVDEGLHNRQLWVHRDAFDVALLHKPDAALKAMLAEEPRIEIVTTFPCEYATLEPWTGPNPIGAPR